MLQIPLTCTLVNEYPSSNEIKKKNGTVCGDCIGCDALLHIKVGLSPFFVDEFVSHFALL